MGCQRNDCYYYGARTETCDYYLLTGVRRGSSVEQCERYSPVDSQDKIIKNQMWAYGSNGYGLLTKKK